MSGTTNFNNVTINNGADLTPAASSIIRVSGTLTNSGTLQARTNANTIEYNGADQTVLNPNGSTAGYSSLILSGSGTKTMPGSALSIGGDFSMSGTASATAGNAITTIGSFTIDSGTTFTTGAFQHAIKGNFLSSGTFTSAGSEIIFNGSSAQIVGGSLATTFNHLTINNTAGVTINTVNPTVTGDLTFTNGKITTGSNTLILGNAARVFNAGGDKYVFGNLQKGIAASVASYTFDIGNSTNWLPATINFTVAPTGGGSITCSTTNGQQPNYATSVLSQTKYLNRYWTVTNSGVTGGTYDATFTFVSGDIVGSAAYSSLLVKKYSGGWTVPATGTNTATTVITSDNSSATFGDFVAGETVSLGTDYYRSNVTAGNWSNAATWQSSPDNSTWGSAGSAPTNAARSITILNGHTITIDATATASDLSIIGTLTSGSGIGLSVNGTWDNSGTFTAGTGTVTFDGTTSISGTSVNSFNNVAISGTLIGPSAGTINVAGNWSNNGTFTHNSGIANFNGSTPQTILGTNSNTFYDLTITNTAGVSVTTADQTVNHTLTLTSANASSTQGALSMQNDHILFMGAIATTAGTGDVSGYINRSSFALNTPYTFGNQYTLINFTAGPLPTSVTFEVYLLNPTWKTNAINRYYDVTQSGGTADTRLRFNAHYLNSELNSNTDGNLDFFDIHTAPSATQHDHGRTDYSNTTGAEWVGFGNVGLVFLGTATVDDHLWTLGTSITGSTCTWIGGSSSGATDWNLPGNWQGGVPLTTSNVIIPTTTYNPVLPDGVNINSLNIQTGGILNATTGNTTLTISGAIGWTNNGTFNAGTGSTVVFSNTAATLNGETNFNNVSIANGAGLTAGTNNIMVIGGALTLTGTLNAATNSNTIEYNGAAQTVVNPNGSPTGYSNLILSGSGDKTMPGSALSIGGDFSMSGTASATAGNTITTTGNFTIGSGTILTSGAFTHNIAGNWTNNGGTFTSTGSTINFYGTGTQSISKTGGEIFNSLTVNKASGALTLSSNATIGGTLTLTSGVINTAAYSLIVNNSATAAISGGSNTSYVNGNLQRSILGGANTYSYPTGTSTTYAPVSMSFTSGTIAGTLTGYTTDGDHASVSSTSLNLTKTVNRNWTFTVNSGLGTANYDATFNWVSADQDEGFDSGSAICGQYTGASWSYPTMGTRSATSAQITGASGFSSFQIGNVLVNPDVPALSATIAPVFLGGSTDLSIATGALNDASNWKWYAGTCGGTLVGTGTLITVSPTVTTTYYARGEGGGVTAGTCGSIEITVSGISWLGVSTDWASTSNWGGGVVPGSGTNVLIPSGTSYNPQITASSACNNITIASGAVLTIPSGKDLTVSGTLTNNSAGGIVIQSDGSGTGSLIAAASSGSGTTIVQRWMTHGAWHIVSSPLSGQTVAAFLTANSNIATKPDLVTRGMMDYKPSDNIWNPFFIKDVDNGSLGAGRGFSMRVDASDAAVTFTGSLQTGSQSATTTSGYWNCIGNPYTSAIGITSGSSSAANFLTINASNFETSYGAIYVWNKPDASNGFYGNYTVISNTAPEFNAVQQGQAFMVNAKVGVSSFSFASAMQIHSSALALKSTKEVWPAIKLFAAVGLQKSSTIIAFNSGMTKGLDVTYDAGLLKGASDLIVYSKLVQDNGIPFAIQALPTNEYSNLIIPIGIDFKTGGKVVFSAELMNLSTDCKVILEDKLLKKFTDLSQNDYSVTIAANSSVSDRFQIHTSYQTTGLNIGNGEGIADKLSAWAVRNTEIRIKGQVSKQAIATLYDIQGRVVLIKNLKEGILNVIGTPNIRNGIYLLSVEDNNQIQGFKILVRE